MEKPKPFIHRERRLYKERSYGEPAQYRSFYHVGRVEVSAEAVFVVCFAYTVVMVVLQIILGITSGGAVWWPAQSILGMGVFFALIGLLKLVVGFFRYLAGEIVIHKAGE